MHPNAKTSGSNKILFCIYFLFTKVVFNIDVTNFNSHPTELLDNFCTEKHSILKQESLTADRVMYLTDRRDKLTSFVIMALQRAKNIN